MNTYFIGYQNTETGKTGSDTFTGATESAARHAFWKCYRPGSYRIICCIKL